MRESDIEKHLVKRVKALGGEVRKVQWLGRRGAPDRLVMLPALQAGSVRVEKACGLDITWRRLTDRCRTAWVELKAPGVKPEAYQLREHARMRAMGQRVVVIDSIDGVEELLW